VLACHDGGHNRRACPASREWRYGGRSLSSVIIAIRQGECPWGCSRRGLVFEPFSFGNKAGRGNGKRY